MNLDPRTRRRIDGEYLLDVVHAGFFSGLGRIALIGMLIVAIVSLGANGLV